MTVLTVNLTGKKGKKALLALKAMMEALELSYDIQEDVNEDAAYDPAFVAKIEKSRADYEAGKGVTIALDDIWK